MNSLKIGKVIYSLLVNDKAVTDKVGKKIYPLIADTDVTFPFIVYKRNDIETVTSKDKYICQEEATIEVVIAADKYNESVDIASAVVDSLITKKGMINEMQVKGIYLESATEDFIEDTFVQILNIKIIINK